MRVERAVGQILQMPAGFAELALAVFAVNRIDGHLIGRREALKAFNARLDDLDAEVRAADVAKSARARLAMSRIVISLERAGRGEYRRRDTRA